MGLRSDFIQAVNGRITWHVQSFEADNAENLNLTPQQILGIATKIVDAAIESLPPENVPVNIRVKTFEKLIESMIPDIVNRLTAVAANRIAAKKAAELQDATAIDGYVSVSAPLAAASAKNKLGF